MIESINLADLCVFMRLPYASTRELKLPAQQINAGKYGTVSVTDTNYSPHGGDRCEIHRQPEFVSVRFTEAPGSRAAERRIAKQREAGVQNRSSKRPRGSDFLVVGG